MRYLPHMLSVVICGALLMPKADALCIYKGKLYAKTTVSEEFHDSQWVVRAKVIAAKTHWSNQGESWTIYDLEVLAKFKGDPPAHIRMFTYQNSGGFYLDKGTAYLLFLDPTGHDDETPAAAKGTTEVNYNCGQSKAWSTVNSTERKQLGSLTGNRLSLTTNH